MPELNFSSSLRRTIQRYGLKANWISERSGVPKQTISSFLNGRQQLQTANLEKLMAVLPFEAQAFLMADLLGQSPCRPSLPTIVEQLELDNPAHRKEAAEAMRLIVAKFLGSDSEQVGENTGESRQLISLKSP